jgi:hypothetical protein
VAFAERPDFGMAFPKITGYFDRSSLLPVRFELLSASGEIQKRIVVGKIESIESRQFGAYPTTIFIGRDGLVKRIHTGFEGKATGERHTRLKAEYVELIETLLAE